MAAVRLTKHRMPQVIFQLVVSQVPLNEGKHWSKGEKLWETSSLLTTTYGETLFPW